MEVKDLSRDQLIELKQALLSQRYDSKGESPSYGELADVDELISDEEIFAAYAGTSFSEDDFFCTAGTDREEEAE